MQGWRMPLLLLRLPSVWLHALLSSQGCMQIWRMEKLDFGQRNWIRTSLMLMFQPQQLGVLRMASSWASESQEQDRHSCYFSFFLGRSDHLWVKPNASTPNLCIFPRLSKVTTFDEALVSDSESSEDTQMASGENLLISSQLFLQHIWLAKALNWFCNVISQGPLEREMHRERVWITQALVGLCTWSIVLWH